MMQLLPPGKVAVVTGIGPGLGREIALGFAELGAKLAIGARNAEMLESVAAEIRAMGGEVIAQRTDLTDRDSCRALVDATVARFGGVDILVQNGHDPGDWSSVENADPDHWRKVMETNLFGALHLYQACLPSMKAKGDGRIVFVNSGAANNRAPDGLSAYAASKAALASLVRSIALENGRYGVRCNSAHMGVIDGANVRPWFKAMADQKGQTLEIYMEQYYDANLPLRYVPTPKECAGTVIFLASDLARTVTGQAVSCNGGEWFAK
jgi:NAD(P)-dependent dehydrogenase (short-subunit alcohol dehydrogenase family)